VKKQPPEFYFFGAVFVALLAAIALMCWHNISPYYNLAKDWFFIGDEPSGGIDILGFRLHLSMAWVVSAIFWAVLQGCQIAYLLYSLSEKALDFVIEKDKLNSKYLVNKNDSRHVKQVKKKRNELPMATWTYLQTFCIAAYTIEAIVNYQTYPIFGSSEFEMIGKAATQSYDFEEISLYILTIVAVESLVFVAIIFYRILEVFVKSGAYAGKTYE
jgi:hypothetical protein